MQPHNSPHQLVLSHVHITSWTIRILPRSDVSTTCIQVLETTKVMGRQNSSLRMHSGTYVSCRTSTWKREIDSDVVSPSQSAIYVKCPTVHDIWSLTAATGLFCRGGKIDGSLLKFCQRHATSLSGTAKFDLTKFKQPVVTFCLLVKIVRPRQCLFFTTPWPRPPNRVRKLLCNRRTFKI